MRTPLLAGIFALLLPACLTGEITGIGDDDDTGSGSGSDTGSGSNVSPRLDATPDKTTVTTQLGKTETVTVNMTSAGGFTGDVALTATLVDGGEVALPNIMVSGTPNVTLEAGGAGQAVFQIQVPMNASGTALTGTLKIELNSSLGIQTVTAPVTINNVYVVDYAAGTGVTTGMHMNAGSVPNLLVKRGAILRFHNSDTIDHIIHGDGTTFPHENQTVGVGGLPGRDYDVNTIAIPPGSAGTLGCHTHGTATYSTYRVE